VWDFDYTSRPLGWINCCLCHQFQPVRAFFEQFLSNKAVFTGLIQALATISPQESDKLRISCSSEAADQILPGLAIGDSVAVDGVCLTVEEIHSSGFVASASPETLRRTTLGRQQLENSWVNLETSLRVGSKLGGHFVTGHVDGVGEVQSLEPTANSWEMTFTAPEIVARYIVPKGSIAVNGVSLTVSDCDKKGTWFKVAVIPHTFAQTNLQYLQPDSWVNLEGDILGKYVERFLHFGYSRETAPSWGEVPNLETITPAFLAEHGYI
jgi:riboflavin synthase